MGIGVTDLRPAMRTAYLMTLRNRNLVARVAGLALAVAVGVFLHALFPLTFGSDVTLSLPLLIPVAVLAAILLLLLTLSRWHSALRVETRLLESAVIHARDAVIVLEAEPQPGSGRRVLYANEAFCRMTGYAREEVVGRSLHRLRGPESDSATLGRLRAALDAGRPLQAELRNYRKDGTEYWAELSLVPVHGPAGRVAHWVMIQRDVTDRKRAQDDLRHSEERLRIIGDNLPGGATYQMLSEPDGSVRCTYIAAGIEEILGLRPAEIVADGKRLFDLIHPEDRERVRLAQAASHHDLVPFDIEFRSRTVAGGLKWLHCRAMPRNLRGGSTERNGVILDVTARKRVEDELRRSEELFRGIFEGTSAGLSLTGPTGRFISCNPAFAAMLGRTVEDVLRLTAADLTHPDDWAAQLLLFDEVRAGTRDRFSFTKRYVKPDGKLVWAELSFTAIRGADGRYEYGLGVSLNVTERQRLEEQLRQTQKMDAIGQMAGGIAHDFNNLLTAVLGNLAEVRLPAADPSRPPLAAVGQAIDRAIDLTRKLLGYARRNQLVPGPVNPADAFDEVLGLLRRTFDPRIGIAVGVAANCSPVLADPTLLNQALMNLCLNARDAMPGGGTLTLAAGVVEATPEEAARTAEVRPGSFVRLSVSDTGAGMTDEVRAKLFEPFFTTKDVGKGTGLGLAMVQGIVKQHRGWVDCTTAPGIGTRFDLYLPAAAAASSGGSRLVHLGNSAADAVVSPAPGATTIPDAPHAAESAGGKTVLLVDDEAMIRTLGRVTLERAGYRVLAAEDGADAVEVFAREHDHIDLIVMDMTMPRMSGRDAFRHIIGLVPSARVLLSTGYSAEDVVELDGAIGLLSKPYRPAELLAAVRDALA